VRAGRLIVEPRSIWCDREEHWALESRPVARWYDRGGTPSRQMVQTCSRNGSLS